MKNKTFLPINLRYFGDGPAGDPSPQPEPRPEPEQDTVSGGDKPEPKTLSFTQDALNAMDAKAKSAGKKSILKQFGISDEKDLPGAVEKFSVFLEAEKNKETEADRLKRVQESLDALTNDHTATLAELSTYKQEKILRKHGVSDEEQLEFLTYKIGKTVSDEKDFEQAAAEYFEKNPIKQDDPKPDAPPKPEIMPRTPAASVVDKPINPLVAAAAKGAGIDAAKIK